MIRKIAVLGNLILFISFFGIKDLWSQDKLYFDESISQSTADTIRNFALTYPNETQLSIAIIKDDNVKFIGVKKSNGELISINNKDSVFEIGSITKVFTSTILVNLILNGKINPDEPISQALPFKLNQSKKDGKSITYKMLSNHTSGIPSAPDSIYEYIEINPENPWVDFNKEKFQQFLKTDMKLTSTPGTTWSYSNLGVALLGYLLEIKAGQPFDSLLQTLVFSKYGMKSSTTNREKIRNRLVNGHNEIGKPVLNWDCNAMSYAGACLSTTNDLSKYVLANFSNDSILKLQQQRTFRVENNAIDLAYGWHVFRNNGVIWYFHNGGTGGYHSNITMDLQKECAVIVLANCTFELEERYLEKNSWKILKTIE